MDLVSYLNIVNCISQRRRCSKSIAEWDFIIPMWNIKHVLQTNLSSDNYTNINIAMNPLTDFDEYQGLFQHIARNN